MREFQILASPLSGVNFAPETLAEEIAQTVRCILATRRGSVPLDRRFGIDFDVIDRTQPAARHLLEQDIVITLAEYEPRVSVSRIDWRERDAAIDGALYPLVTVAVKEEFTNGS